MRIALLTPYYTPAYRGGGPIRTAVAMVAEHSARHEFLVLTGDTDWGQTQPLSVPTQQWARVGQARVWYVRSGHRGALLAGLRAVRRQRPDVVYLNSVLHPTYSILPLTLARLGFFGDAQLLLAPRGELGSGALQLKSTKKRLFLAAARATGLHRRVTWHASSDQEAGEIQSVFPRARVVVRPNEVLLPAQALRPVDPGPDALDEPDAHTPPLRVVFLSRLSPKKGLHVLLAALARLDPGTAITLDVFGTGDSAYLASCRSVADSLPPQVSVTFHGSIPAEQVREAFAAADVFAFPTAHENFGHAIAEALSASCPVFLADVTPWTPVLRDGGGEIFSDTSPEAWAAALTRWAATTPRQRHARRLAAGAAYERWQATRPRTSVFDLAFGVETP